MPGPRPIDVRQQTHDRLGTLKQTSSIEQERSYALKAQGLNQFGATSSEQLAQVITDETGTGNLVYNTNAILYTPQIDTVSRIITSEVTTETTTANQVLMSFPLYEGTDIGTNVIIGSADVIIQTDVGDTTGSTPEAVIRRRLTKMLVLMDHDWNGDGNPQVPSPNHTEYGHTATTTNICTYNFAYRSATKTFNIEVTPLTNNTMRHRVIAFCMFGMDRNWSAPPVAVP